jgi:GntR family transcriptional regulator/MocR family aminotransferase
VQRFDEVVLDQRLRELRAAVDDDVAVVLRFEPGDLFDDIAGEHGGVVPLGVLERGPSGRGAPALHEALTAYLNRVRGTSATPENVVICNGYAQGAGLIIQTLVKSGATRLAVEDPRPTTTQSRWPGRPVSRSWACRVDEDGIRIEALEVTDADALILTPSHQWPTGAVLSARARAAALRWAERRGALIIEDDYDAEYRYDRAPIGSDAGPGTRAVIYAGTASKTLAPGLRLGWLVVPGHLVNDVSEAKSLADRGSPVLDQLAFADFLGRGEFDRDLRSMRPLYRRRRDTLNQALRVLLPDVEPAGIAAGLHPSATCRTISKNGA